MNALAHQQELNRIEQLEGAVCHETADGEFFTQVWADSDKVYIAINSELSNTTFFLTRKSADVLADQISIALRRYA